MLSNSILFGSLKSLAMCKPSPIDPINGNSLPSFRLRPASCSSVQRVPCGRGDGGGSFEGAAGIGALSEEFAQSTEKMSSEGVSVRTGDSDSSRPVSHTSPPAHLSPVLCLKAGDIESAAARVGSPNGDEEEGELSRCSK